MSTYSTLLQMLQGHYDFGMRALKAVLMMAGSLKRASKQDPEAVVAIRALRDANLPKLLTDVSVRCIDCPLCGWGTLALGARQIVFLAKCF